MCRKLVLLATLFALLSPAGVVMAGFDPALVAWWSFDEGAGTVAADGSGNGNDGTVEGAATWVTGVLDAALQFNGSNAYVNAPYIPFNDRSFTIAMWINPGQTSSDHIFFAQVQANATDTSLHIRIPAGGAVRMGFYNNDLDSPAGSVEVGNWYHVALWYDYENQNRRIYLNGEMVAQAAATPYKGTSGNTHIGQWDGGEYFNGMIDDVQVYHKPLSDAEVVKIMAGLADQSVAQSPSPEDGSVDIPRDVVLSWTAGEFAATHDVYFGTSFDDVNAASRANPLDVLLSQSQAATTYDPDGLLEFNTTYYWRIDEVNAAPDNTIFKGEIWSFTSEPFAYPVANIIATSNGDFDAAAGPEKTVDGSGINAADQH
ncbi:MAG: LamG domain-containing protein, partial [Planctomycetes bacterium]|nr:LamG domain-containing protein [Planctomycetota bacterium]